MWCCSFSMFEGCKKKNFSQGADWILVGNFDVVHYTVLIIFHINDSVTQKRFSRGARPLDSCPVRFLILLSTYRHLQLEPRLITSSDFLLPWIIHYVGILSVYRTALNLTEACKLSSSQTTQCLLILK